MKLLRLELAPTNEIYYFFKNILLVERPSETNWRPCLPVGSCYRASKQGGGGRTYFTENGKQKKRYE